MLEYRDFALGVRACAAGLLDERRLWELVRRLEQESPPAPLAEALVREGIATAEQVQLLSERPPSLSSPLSLPRPPSAPTVVPSGGWESTVVRSDAGGPPPTIVVEAAPQVAGAVTAPAAPAVPPAPRASPTPDGGAAFPCAFGKYELLAQLGRGGMGVVYRAREKSVGRLVALKTALPDLASEPARIARFQREVRTAASLRHPAIVAIHDVGLEQGTHYFTMDLIEGSTLAERLARGPVPLREGLTWLAAVADALEYAHSQGILHRDVKPSNLLLDAAGRPFLSDFGLAKDIDSGTQLTASGTLVGTPAYMSPEQVRGERTTDARSDVFSLGAVMYEVLTGRPPFDGETLAALFQRILNDDPAPVRRLNPRVHPDVEVACLKALAKEPAHRYASAGALAEDLRRFLDGEPIVARAPSLRLRAVRWSRKRRLPLALGAALALAGASFVHHLAVQAGGRRARAELDLARATRGDSRGAHLALALSLDPSLVDGWVLLSAQRLGLGCLPEALEAAGRAVRLAPADPAARLARLRIFLFGLGDARPALAEAEAAGDPPQNTAVGRVLLGYRELLRGRVEESRGHFEAARALDSACLPAATALLRFKVREGRLDSEANQLAKLCTDDVEEPEFHLATAEYHAALCRYGEAISQAEKALAHSPTFLEAKLSIAESERMLRHDDEALEACDRAVKLADTLARAFATARPEPAVRFDAAGWARRIAAQRARICLSAGRKAEARELLARLAREGDPQPQLAARLAESEGDWEAARREYERADASGSGGASAAAGLGACLLRAGKGEEAFAAFDRALALYATDLLPRLHVERTEEPLRMATRDTLDPKDHGQVDFFAFRILHPLERALDLDPRCAPARVRQAWVCILAMELAKARGDLDAAVEANPRCAEAWRARGCFLRDHRDVRDLDRAEADLREALRLEPASLPARLEVGAVDLARGRAAEALAAADAALATRPAWARAWKLRADALTKLGRGEEAALAEERWKQGEVDEKAGEIALGIGLAYSRSRRYSSAIELFKRSIEHNPRNWHAFTSRSDCLFRLMRVDEGFLDRARAIRLRPGYDLEHYETFLQMKVNQPTFVAIAANAMLGLDRRFPKDPCTPFLLGFGYLVSGNAERAYVEFSRTLVVDPGFAAAHTFLALSALRCGKPDVARTSLARSEEGGPDAQLLHLVRACLLAGEGRREEAARELAVVARKGVAAPRVMTELRELDPLKEEASYKELRKER
ncbi:MAG: protein kinase [Planctomycetes bacterium]|nr:protein kinase [Planctomycetota bacterium]